MTILRAAVLAALFLSIVATPLRADDVTLRARDGSIELDGTLLSFDGEFYRIDTDYGVLTVDASGGVSCDGPGCPNLGSYVAEFTISGAQEMGRILIPPALIEGFALRHSYALQREEVTGTGLLYTLFEGDARQPAARITIRLTTSAEALPTCWATRRIWSCRCARQRDRSARWCAMPAWAICDPCVRSG